MGGLRQENRKTSNNDNFNSDEGLSRFQKSIEKMGLEAALRERGIKEGDSVKILDLEFEYSE